jgi:hypothetical protein
VLFIIPQDAALEQAHTQCKGTLSIDNAKIYVISTLIGSLATGALTIHNGMYGAQSEKKKNSLIEFIIALIHAASHVAKDIRDIRLQIEAYDDVARMEKEMSDFIRKGRTLH